MWGRTGTGRGAISAPLTIEMEKKSPFLSGDGLRVARAERFSIITGNSLRRRRVSMRSSNALTNEFGVLRLGKVKR